MLIKEFENWLSTKYENTGTINSRKTNCLTVCQYEGDLDVQYDKDLCNSLINKLTYTSNDEQHNRPPKHKIPINGNIRNGTATLKQAVNLYIKFKNNMKYGSFTAEIKTTNTVRFKSKEWPIWDLPSDEEIYQLAKIVTNYIRFLDPKIIEAITLDNNKHYKTWRDMLSKKNVNFNIYLWENSPCCFPGIRRYAGSKEIAYYHNHTEMENNDIPNALKLDDNSFPKQIWSFIFRGKQFSKFGPPAYSLAHLIDHKKSKNRMGEELEFLDKNGSSEPFFGLYTCPTNTVYVPNSLLKPTDFNTKLRVLLFQKAEALYSKYCNIIPSHIKIPKTNDEKWNINSFTWAKCVGDIKNIEIFLQYRKKVMNKYLNE